jgi:signal transduction histidine kinase
MAADPLPSRTRSARLTLISLLLIPLLSLAVLWGLIASITLGNVIRYQHYNTVITAIGPSVTALEQTLPVERAITLVWLGSGRSPLMRAELAGARRGTDKYVPAVRSAVMSVRGLLSAKAVAQMNVFLQDLAGLGRIRTAVDSGTYDSVAAFNAYSAIGNAEYEFFHISSPPADPDLSLMTQAAIAEARAQDFTGGAIGLIAGAITAGGVMSPPERVLFAQTVGQQNMEISDTFALANPVLTTLFKRVYNLPAYQGLQAIENQIEASPADQPIPVNSATFQTMAQTIQAAVLANGAQIGVVLAAESAHLRDSTVTELVLAAGLGLVGVAASIFVVVRFGRRLRVELSNLYESARQMAHERLPRVVERLGRGEDVDVQAESPPLKTGRITEIADVAQAFSTVQRTAVEAAVGQAGLRKGVNQVFVNLSLRTQSLLHRQLGMLDTMERATSDPASLADLFRLDHLTTRMRRHAEGLLILAGTTPGRGWRDPVPVADVLQAAIAEVEDYVRVDVITESADAVAGIAVNDVIHLIAELVENATTFSPPNTRVVISGGIVAHGFAVEIEDRGLGMAPDAIAAVNEHLASPPEFDLANSERLGLFVAGQLAARHGIRVSLRPSPFGGTTAIVLLPPQIIVPENEADAWFGPGSTVKLPAAAASGLAHDARPTGSQERDPAFGMTGRHRLALSSPSPESGQADGTEPDEPPLAGTGSPFLALPPAPGQTAPGPAQAQPGALMAAAAAAGWAIGPAGPTGPIPGAASGPSRAANGTAADETYLGLPRRVRQASLAPELRGQLGAESAARPREAAEPAARSPEETGSRMFALQDGWQRGRRDEMDYPDIGLDILGGRPGGASGAEAESNDSGGES